MLLPDVGIWCNTLVFRNHTQQILHHMTSPLVTVLFVPSLHLYYFCRKCLSFSSIIGASSSVWGIVKRRHSGEKRSRWWYEEVKLTVRRKKLLYKRFLDTGTDEAKDSTMRQRLRPKSGYIGRLRMKIGCI